MLQTVESQQNLEPRASQDPTCTFEPQYLPMGGGKPFPELVKDRKAYVVEFDGPTDGWNPQNWPSSRRLVIHSED
jgi:DHA1 family multidrug resistance protein-like MFS transporter